jgi:hypothetical protein
MRLERHPDDAGLHFRQNRLLQRRQQSAPMAGAKAMSAAITAAA